MTYLEVPIERNTLRKFIEKGGYSYVESVKGWVDEEGKTRYRILAQLNRLTGLDKITIMKIKKQYPTKADAEKIIEPRPTLESTGPPKNVWIKQEDYDRLKETNSRLKEVEKTFEKVQEYFRRSLIVDLRELRARQELLGESLESFQLALKRQVETDEKQQSVMEKVFDDALRELNYALVDLRRVIP